MCSKLRAGRSPHVCAFHNCAKEDKKERRRICVRKVPLGCSGRRRKKGGIVDPAINSDEAQQAL